jgi:cytochrome c oxidase subunit 4
MKRELIHRFGVYGALLALLVLTTASAFLNLGAFNGPVNFGIAAAKASLVYWFFMELRTADGLVRLAALSVIFWLAVLLCADAADWLTR